MTCWIGSEGWKSARIEDFTLSQGSVVEKKYGEKLMNGNSVVEVSRVATTLVEVRGTSVHGGIASGGEECIYCRPTHGSE